jgi:hypothetical protein
MSNMSRHILNILHRMFKGWLKRVYLRIQNIGRHRHRTALKTLLAAQYACPTHVQSYPPVQNQPYMQSVALGLLSVLL